MRTWGKKLGIQMSDQTRDGGDPFAWWRRECGDHFDGILAITAKPFHRGGTRAFDPEELGDA